MISITKIYTVTLVYNQEFDHPTTVLISQLGTTSLNVFTVIAWATCAFIQEDLIKVVSLILS